MFRWIAAFLVATVFFVPLAEAQDRMRLGYGRLVTNDFIGDGKDRWRTGGIQSSRVWGPAWTGAAPARFGELIELRLGAEIVAPDDLAQLSPTDRAYAGALSVGLHTHFQRGQTEFAVGGDLVFVGPQTGLDDFQDALHDLLNVTRPSDAVRAGQIGNAITPTAVVEVGQSFALGERAAIRPFFEGRVGNETLARVGVDLTIGQLGRGELLVRDAVTGQRYRAVEADWSGYSLVVGGDVAAVSDSQFLPEGGAARLRDTRERLRAGVTWRSETGISAFYGVTYLGKEFEGQSEGQVVGSVRLRVPF